MVKRALYKFLYPSLLRDRVRYMPVPRFFQARFNSQYMPDLESSKYATCIVTKPPRILTKIEASLQSGQKEYLVNGEMRAWKGKTQDVWSPIYIKTDKGLEQKRIGSYPITDASDAMEVLYAGVKAYANGRGEWPSMTVSKRIECV